MNEREGVIGMKTFLDIAGNKVELTFSGHVFQEEARHVLVICQYQDQWLLTRHKIRGLEFPGGKMEVGESLEEAAVREVYEETGAVLNSLINIGEYRVSDSAGVFVKAVFWGMVGSINQKNDYLETNGPLLVSGDILKLRWGREYSFIMKDQVIEECMNRISLLIKE
jgi:8-oxo-dGTP diphosphatase